ncbi:MAG: hypothetical protein AB1489_16100 [Acidobacteriota bacterium]
MDKRNSEQLRRGLCPIESVVTDKYSRAVPLARHRCPGLRRYREQQHLDLSIQAFWKTHRTLPKATRQRHYLTICVPSPVIRLSIGFEGN